MSKRTNRTAEDSLASIHITFLRLDLEYDAWHTPGDTLDAAGARSLQIVGDVVVGALPQIEARFR